MKEKQMFKANPSKSMSDHITSMHKGKKDMFGKKDKMKKKGKFSFLKKKKVMDSDNDDM